LVFAILIAFFYVSNLEIWQRHQNKYMKRIGRDRFSEALTINPDFTGHDVFSWKDQKKSKERFYGTTKIHCLWSTGLALHFLAMLSLSVVPQFFI
jgi:hypothetical protein